MKADELSWHLDRPVAHHKLDLPEIQSLDPHEVTSFKAREAYRQLNRPVIVEDFSMRFEAQGHLPGPLIKWFLQELKPQGLCKMLDGYESRVAYAQTCFAYCAGDEVRVFDGIMRGVITSEPCGSHGYGIEAIFIPDGWQKTWGQMNKEEQVTSSVRRIGLKKLEAYLKSN